MSHSSFSELKVDITHNTTLPLGDITKDNSSDCMQLPLQSEIYKMEKRGMRGFMNLDKRMFMYLILHTLHFRCESFSFMHLPPGAEYLCIRLCTIYVPFHCILYSDPIPLSFASMWLWISKCTYISICSPPWLPILCFLLDLTFF